MHGKGLDEHPFVDIGSDCIRYSHRICRELVASFIYDRSASTKSGIALVAAIEILESEFLEWSKSIEYFKFHRQ